MTGTLGLFSLSDLFQLLASASRTGRLAVEHPRGAARVYFEKGRVVHADFGELTGADAVYALFADEQGDFEFTHGLPAPEHTVEVGTENLMLEAIRRLDEARRDEPTESVARSAVPALSDDEHDHLTLQPMEFEVLRRVDGKRNVTQIALDAGIEPEDAMRVVARLAKVGSLKILPRPPRVARLVTKLARRGVPAGHAGIDPGILATWERAIEHTPTRLVARREDGRTLSFGVTAVEGAGPYVHMSRDTLVRADLAANETLLFRPLAVGTSAGADDPAGDARGTAR